MSTFIAGVIVRHSKPWFGSTFKVIISSFHSAFRATFFISAFRAIIHFPFGVQSHCPFFVWRSMPYFHFGVQSHRSSSIWHSEPLLIFRLEFRVVVHPQFGVQGCIFISTSRAITFSIWLSKPLFILVQYSEPLHHSLRRSEPLPIFASAFIVVTSLILAFRATPLVRHSDSHFHLGIQSHTFSSAFRAVLSSWHSESCLQFGVQSQCLSSIWCSGPHS